MTSDATHSIQAAPDPVGLRDVITGARCLLFGFDGPLCRLFPGHRAGRVADGLLDRLRASAAVGEAGRAAVAEPELGAGVRAPSEA
ncbi:hypothetical protein ACFWJN_09760, partial [Streptomyces albidochromogenes]